MSNTLKVTLTLSEENISLKNKKYIENISKKCSNL